MTMTKHAFFVTLFLALFGLTGCGGDGRTDIDVPGVDGPYLNLIDDNLLITADFENIQIDGGLRYNIPKYPNSYIELSPSLNSDGLLFALSANLNDLLDGEGKIQDPKRLPGGRAIPGVVTGQLPAVAFSIEKFKNMTFYLGENVFGVFVPMNDLDIPVIVSGRIYMEDKAMGLIHLVNKDQEGKNSGMLLMLNLTEKQRRKLERYNRRF